jgi:hypothetical protein
MNEVDPNARSAPSPGKQSLERILRAAAQAGGEEPESAPYGFDTRVVALWRASLPNNGNGMSCLLRRVAVLSVVVIVVSSVAAVYEINQERESNEPFTNAFAIADSAIQSEVP